MLIKNNMKPIDNSKQIKEYFQKIAEQNHVEFTQSVTITKRRDLILHLEYYNPKTNKQAYCHYHVTRNRVLFVSYPLTNYHLMAEDMIKQIS